MNDRDAVDSVIQLIFARITIELGCEEVFLEVGPRPHFRSEFPMQGGGLAVYCYIDSLLGRTNLEILNLKGEVLLTLHISPLPTIDTLSPFGLFETKVDDFLHSVNTIIRGYSRLCPYLRLTNTSRRCRVSSTWNLCTPPSRRWPSSLNPSSPRPKRGDGFAFLTAFYFLLNSNLLQ